jgi:O-acetyl-ADP-ribose deacetylase (regulator of RNase III)
MGHNNCSSLYHKNGIDGTDVNNLLKNVKINFIVSPANSFGTMRGGIDKVYAEIFPMIENTVQNKINFLGITLNDRQKYLPIGSAITVKTNNIKCPYLVSVPTMYLAGSDISNSKNVFYCFTSILYIANNNKNYVIACPGLGTNIGKMTPKDSIDQIEYAIKNFNNTMYNSNYLNNIKYSDNMNLVLKR